VMSIGRELARGEPQRTFGSLSMRGGGSSYLRRRVPACDPPQCCRRPEGCHAPLGDFHCGRVRRPRASEACEGNSSGGTTDFRRRSQSARGVASTHQDTRDRAGAAVDERTSLLVPTATWTTPPASGTVRDRGCRRSERFGCGHHVHDPLEPSRATSTTGCGRPPRSRPGL
jgi:hypothetical protein